MGGNSRDKTKKTLKPSGFKKTYKHFLGVHVCPAKGCPRVESPTEGAEKKHASPSSNMGSCAAHPDLPLRHISCSCLLFLTKQSDCWSVFHQGTHEHSKPPLDTKIDPDSYKQLENIVLISPEITPVQLKVGTSTRDPVSSIHPSFANNDKLKYHRGKILKNNTKTDYLLDVINDISAVEPNFFRKYDILN